MDSAKVSEVRKCRQAKAGERRQDQGEASVGGTEWVEVSVGDVDDSMQ